MAQTITEINTQQINSAILELQRQIDTLKKIIKNLNNN